MHNHTNLNANIVRGSLFTSFTLFILVWRYMHAASDTPCQFWILFSFFFFFVSDRSMHFTCEFFFLKESHAYSTLAKCIEITFFLWTKINIKLTRAQWNEKKLECSSLCWLNTIYLYWTWICRQQQQQQTNRVG